MSEFTLIEFAVLLLAPLALMAAFLLGYLEWILGKSEPLSGDLEHLVEKKNADGFARLARRIRPNRSRSVTTISSSYGPEPGDELARLARSKHPA